MKKLVLISILVFFAFLVPSKEIAFAEGGIAWEPEGKPICEAPQTQQNIRMVSDGSGGAIIVWEDFRDIATAPDIYAQRINEYGEPLWDPTNGVIVSTAPNNQVNPVIVNDGSGGAIIAWEDWRAAPNPVIYAVRISSDSGGIHPAWSGASEIKLRDVTTSYQFSPEIAISGQGEAIVVWEETDASIHSIYTQRIDSSGNLSWTQGLAVSTGTLAKGFPKIIRSDTDNVIVTWQDKRNGDYDIYAHRINIPGGLDPSWDVDGSTVTIANGNQEIPEIVADGSGGAIITWTDYRDGNGDIYAQLISSSGAQVWTPDGIPICKEMNEQYNPVIINALFGGTTKGAIIAWQDGSSGDSDIYAVRIGTYTPSIEPGNEVLIAGGYSDQKSPRMVGNDEEGGIITWIEDSDRDQIYAQRRDKWGDTVWISPSEVYVCEATEIKEHCIISDGSDGVIIAWVGRDAATDCNIYAQRVSEDQVELPSAWISGWVVRFSNGQGITGVEVEALKDDKSVSGDTTLNGYYEITGLETGTTYEVRATWTVDGIESSVSMEDTAPSSLLFFTLEIDYELGTIVGNVSGVEKKYVASFSRPQSKRISGSGLQKILSPGNGIAFVELEQKDKVIVRVPVEMDGSYSIPNLLPGRFIARAYNGTIYSKPRTVNLKEGETFKVNFVFGIMPGETVFSYPNPAKKGSTTIRYYCGYSDPEGEIKIYDIAGELVRKVRDSEIDKTDAAEHIYRFLWDCKNNSGKGVASGVYIYIVEVKDKDSNESKKVVKRLAVIR